MGTASPDDSVAGASRTEQMEAIVTEHEAGLLRYAARILNDPVAAQDVVQNAFIKLCRGWTEGLRPSAQLRSWLYRVTHNEAVDHIRRESRRAALHERQAGETPEEVCADGAHCDPAGDHKALVLSLLRKMHPTAQQVVYLRLEQGLSYKEISAVTGRSIGNVGNILHHTVKQLAAGVRKAGAQNP